MAHICKWKIGQVALILSAGWSLGSAVGTDNAHFYKPPSMYGSSPSCWFEYKDKCDTRKCDVKDWLTKLDFSYTGGQAKKMWNGNGRSDSVLNPGGPFSLGSLGVGLSSEGVPGGIQNQYYNAIEELAEVPGLEYYGLLSFSSDSKFTMNEFDATWRQNLVKGFFFEASLPVRQLKVSAYLENDSLEEFVLPGTEATYEVMVKENLDLLTSHNYAGLNTLLGYYGLDPIPGKYSQTGVGDLSLHVGWEDVFKCYFPMGFTLKAGVVCPTGKGADQNNVLSMPLGYDQNVGLNAYAQWDIAFIKWLTFRAHGDVTYFCQGRNKTRRIQTGLGQPYWLKLSTETAKIQDGVLWHLGGDLNFDHVVGGLSARVGYSFTQQEKNKLKLIYNSTYNSGIANTDSRLAMWNQHTIHTMVDYDFSVHCKKSCWAPRLAGFYNVPVAGKNAFKTQTYGGTLGFDIKWDF